jgi:hypothetical protein
MLLTPFVAASILGWPWTLELPAGLAAILLVFIIREPLTVLARQKWVWRAPNPATASAKRALAWQLPVLLSIGGYLWASLPRLPLLAMSAVGVLMTVVAVWMTVRNRSRSIVLQIASAFALTSAGLLAALATAGRLPAWAWQLWILMSLHSVIGALNVHARLEQKRRRRTTRGSHATALAVGLAGLLGVLAVVAWRSQFWAGAVPLGFSALVALVELARLRRAGALDEPFQRVGLRLLAMSLVHAALVVTFL